MQKTYNGHASKVREIVTLLRFYQEFLTKMVRIYYTAFPELQKYNVKVCMSVDPLSRLFQIEEGEECYVRPSWHITLATKHNCDALGVTFDPHVNKAIFVYGIIDKDGEVSMARSKPQSWDVHKKWQPFLVVPAKDLSLPETKNELFNHWIGPSLIQNARDLIASEGYAVPHREENQTNVVTIPVSDESGASMQMAAQDYPQPQL